MRIVILLFVQLLVFNCFAQSGRENISLKNIPWNYAILLDDEMIKSTDELNQQLNIFFNISYFDDIDESIKVNTAIICSIDFTDKLSDMTILSLVDATPVFDVWMNGKKLSNLQEDANFVSDISSFTDQKQAVLVLKFRKDFKFLNELKYSDLISMISNFNIYSFSGVGIVRFEPKKDTYFNSYLIEAHLMNFTEKNVDGKIHARFINKDTHEVIFENNNCAFTRMGEEAVIDVIFPEMGSSLIPGQYIGEVEMVDKENNEETIDRMLLLIRIW